MAACKRGAAGATLPPQPHVTAPPPRPPSRAAAPQEFPITQDGLTTQQLAYLRLARVQDPAQLAKVRAGGGQA